MDDDQKSRGRSAKRRSSVTRKLSRNCNSPPDYTDHDVFPPLAQTISRSRTEHIIPPIKDVHTFGPISLPLPAVKTQADRQLRTARLVLLPQLSRNHPLVARVNPNGSLKPTFHPSSAGRSQQETTDLANATRRKEQQQTAEKRMAELLVRNRMSLDRITAYAENADKLETERRNSLKEEVERESEELEIDINSLREMLRDCARLRDAEFEMEIRDLSNILDQCTVLTEELEGKLLLSLDIGIAT